MEIFDYYTNFEGEPEVKLIHKNKYGHTIALLKLWVGFFDSIMTLIKPEENGNWRGVPLHYHMATGWYDEPWECQNLDLFLSQLESINNNELNKRSNEILDKLKEVLTNCRDSQGNFIIEYD